MNLTVELGNGQTAQLRDPATLTNGQRRPIVNASNKYLNADLDPLMKMELQRAVAKKDEERQKELLAAIELGVPDDSVMKVGDVTITVLVESWTLDLPVPSEKPIFDADGLIVGSEILDEISAWDYDRLQRACSQMLHELRWSGGPPAGKAPRSPRSKPR